MPEKTCEPAPTGGKRSLGERPLLSGRQAWEMMGIFKVLANDTRLRLLHALAKKGELCVTDLAEAVEMKPQAVSNQLQRLVDRNILGTRRSGTNIFYRVVDPCVTSLLDLGLCLTEDSRGRAPSVRNEAGSEKGALPLQAQGGKRRGQ